MKKAGNLQEVRHAANVLKFVYIGSMKNLCRLAIAWVLMAGSIQAQDTTYYRHFYEKVTDPALATHYELVVYEDEDSLRANVMTYYMDDKLKSVTPYSNYKKRERHGVQSKFYANGDLYSTQRFVQNKAEGIHHVYYPNGTIKREDHYKADKLDQGKCFAQDGSDTAYFDFEKFPQFPGGDQKLLEFMAKNTKYPPLARENNQQGVVVVTFLISETGAIENARILRSVSKELDNETLRIVGMLPPFEPGEIDGQRVAVQYNLPFRFSLR